MPPTFKKKKKNTQISYLEKTYTTMVREPSIYTTKPHVVFKIFDKFNAPKKSKNVLGVIFYSKLNWNQPIVNAISKAKSHYLHSESFCCFLCGPPIVGSQLFDNHL